MTNKHRIYLIIQQRRIVSLQDLYDITRLNKMSVLKALSILTVKRKIKAIQDDKGRYFHIIDKPLKNG